MTSTLHVILDLLRHNLHLSIGEREEWMPQTGEFVTVLNARSASGESWTVRGEDYYEVVCELATRVGFELDDG